MKKKVLLFVAMILLGSFAGLAQKFYVTVEGMGFPDAKTNMVSGSRSDMLSKARLVVVPDIGIVVSYWMSYLPKRGDYAGPYETKGADMNDKEKDLVKGCGYGDKFFFEGIQVKLKSTGEIRKVNAFIVDIK